MSCFLRYTKYVLILQNFRLTICCPSFLEGRINAIGCLGIGGATNPWVLILALGQAQAHRFEVTRAEAKDKLQLRQTLFHKYKTNKIAKNHVCTIHNTNTNQSDLFYFFPFFRCSRISSVVNADKSGLLVCKLTSCRSTYPRDRILHFM